MKEKKASYTTTLLLCLFLGHLGIHRFYVGKTGTGFLMLFSAGGLGVWHLIDLGLILFGKFKTKEGGALVPRTAI